MNVAENKTPAKATQQERIINIFMVFSFLLFAAVSK
jgi:hypothetical protein